METNLNISQSQRLQQRLTPLQVNYVRMLEMNGAEFEEEVRRQLDEMPALEATYPDGPSAQSATEDGGEFRESSLDLQRADYRSDDDIPDYLRRQMMRRSQRLPEDYYTPTAIASESLIEHLGRQLDQLHLSDDERVMAQYIIGNLEDNGYLTRSLDDIISDIALATGQQYTPAQLRQSLKTVQALDPAGIAAVDLRSCLLLQLRRLPESEDVKRAVEIVRDYFDLFAKKHYERISSSLGISEDALMRAIEVISHLNPKPASQYEREEVPTVIPDFNVEVDNDQTIRLTLANRVPELSITASFKEDNDPPASNTASVTRARAFIRQKRDEASDFIKIVGMRQQTLMKVMSAIVKMQRPFFLSEDEADIQPMVLRQLADDTGLDLSVVSRATQGKYVMTASGIYPLKKFFNEQRENTDTTTAQVIAALKSIIEKEDKRHPLSDQQITQTLVDQGFDIARRTVAKYREKLGYPVGRLRKEL